MTDAPAIRPEWNDRDVPLPAAAVVAQGPALAGLARSTLHRLSSGCLLSASAGDGFLVVFGEEADLPWSDGAVYLGWDDEMLLPTTSGLTPRAAIIGPAARAAAGPHDVILILPGCVLRSRTPRPAVDQDRISAMAEPQE